VQCRSEAGSGSLLLEADPAGRWWVDGAPAPHLAGCLDVDLESSAMTNTLPVLRLGLRRDQAAATPAAYVRAPDLSVERLEQTYARCSSEGAGSRYDYTAPAFEFACELAYDTSGLVLVYPGIAVRAG
jgi:hypothetical protein